MAKNTLKVFINYVPPDREIAYEIKAYLNELAWRNQHWVECWLYDEEVKPGEPNWDIPHKALSESAVVLSCFSSKSVNADGLFAYIQNQAKIYAISKAEDAIYIIPVALERDIKLPFSLNMLKPTIWYDENWRFQLKEALRRSAGRLEIRPAPPAPSLLRRETGKARILDTGKILYIQRIVDELTQLVTHFNYTGALTILEQDATDRILDAKELRKPSNRVRFLLQHAQARLLFQFGQADKALADFDLQNLKADFSAYQALPAVGTIQENDQNYAMRFCCGAIAELYWQTALDWETGRYAEYLARLKTLTDRINLFVLELATGLAVSFEEAKLYHQRSAAGDFANLSVLKEVYNRYFTPKSTFTNSCDLAGTLADFLVRNNTTPRSDSIVFPTGVDRWLTDEIYQKNLVGKGENFLVLLELLAAGDDSQTADKPMFYLTRLRNSLPPAHSFGSISHGTILAAISKGLASASLDDRPYHLVIGDKLARLNCWKTYFAKDEICIPGEWENSPFVKLNKKIQNYLEKVAEAQFGSEEGDYDNN